MIRKFLEFFIGSSLRFQMTVLYLITFVWLSLAKALDPVAFATFSSVYGVWIISETVRRAK